MKSTTRHNLPYAFLSTIALSISLLPLQGATLITYSGSSSAPITFDTGDLSLLSGTISSGANVGQDFAFDESGRLFGINFDRIYEYDPVSLSVLDSASVSGDINGLAARNGILYTYSGSSSSPITFDANDFSLLSGTISSGANAGQDVAFDESGRLFGINFDRIYEYDPVSLSVLDSAFVTGDINGLAIIPEPSTTILALIGSLWWTCQRRTRRRS